MQDAARPLLRSAEQEVPSATLDDILAKREAFLGDYQSKRFAAKYRKQIDAVRTREQALGIERDDLSRAVARYYFKLLAVKDEYEIARLYSDGSFKEQIERQFEGNYRLELHLAPPHWLMGWATHALRIVGLASRSDQAPFFERVDPDTGRVRKVEFGPWFFGFMNLLAKGKVLRGTPLDLPNQTPHRKLERQLAQDYLATLGELLDNLSEDNYDLAVQIASIPELIRGYESVKETTLEQAKHKERELLEAFRLQRA